MPRASTVKVGWQPELGFDREPSKFKSAKYTIGVLREEEEEEDFNDENLYDRQPCPFHRLAAEPELECSKK